MSRISYSNGPLNFLWEYQLECCFPYLLGQAQVKGDSTTKSVIDVNLLGNKIQRNLREFHSMALPIIYRNE